MSELDDIRKRTEGHVPGPWYQTDDEDYTYVFKDYKDTRYTIATAEDGWLECGSNAALIAAAPDLLRLATEQEAELARCQEIAERDGRDYADLKAELAEAVRLMSGLIPLSDDWHTCGTDMAEGLCSACVRGKEIGDFIDRQGAPRE